jgi:hypothetical protein
MKTIEEDNTDIICIQEPYTLQSKVAGITKSYKTFTTGEGRSRAAVVVTNKQIDTILIKQLSDADSYCGNNKWQFTNHSSQYVF